VLNKKTGKVVLVGGQVGSKSKVESDVVWGFRRGTRKEKKESASGGYRDKQKKKKGRGSSRGQRENTGGGDQTVQKGERA